MCHEVHLPDGFKMILSFACFICIFDLLVSYALSFNKLTAKSEFSMMIGDICHSKCNLHKPYSTFSYISNTISPLIVLELIAYFKSASEKVS